MFEQSIRKSCTECGAPIDWVKPEQMDARLQGLAKEAAQWLDGPVSAVWLCSRATCAEIGFFSAVHVSF